MSVKVEGTIVFEGLIEGPLPPFPDAQQRLEKWARGVGDGAIPFNLQIDSGHFSALPSNVPLQVKVLISPGPQGPSDPSILVADALSDLLRLFPPPDRGHVFSTLRSMEYRPNQELQTLYAVGPDGRAATRQQTVPCQTIAAEAPINRREMIKRGLLGLGIAILLLLASSRFVDYPGLWRHLTAKVEAVKISVNGGAFAPYFQVEVTGLDRGTGMLLLKLTRTGLYPQNEAALDALYADPPEAAPASAPVAATGTAPAPASSSAPAATLGLVRRRLAVESLAKGIVRVEFRDSTGELLDEAILHVGALADHATLDVQIPVPTRDRDIVVPASVTLLAE